MSRKNKRSNGGFLNSSFNKSILIVVEVAVLLTIVVLVCLVANGKVALKPSADNTHKYEQTEGVTLDYKKPQYYTTEPSKKNDGKADTTNAQDNSFDFNWGVNETQGSNSSNNSQAQLADPSGWTVAQILQKATSAVNQTKAYTGNLLVNHTESFTADVKECTGGDIVKSVANLMVGWVVSPVDETLSYKDGRAVNSEGESVPIILPKKGAFTLTEDGVKSASISRSGNEYIIKINIVKESVGMYDVPKHNAASIGYLDVANFDLSLFDVDSADIVYSGSALELHINADGYVTYAKYRIPMNIKGSAHRGSISGSAVFDGEQTEIWTLNW